MAKHTSPSLPSIFIPSPCCPPLLPFLRLSVFPSLSPFPPFLLLLSPFASCLLPSFLFSLPLLSSASSLSSLSPSFLPSRLSLPLRLLLSPFAARLPPFYLSSLPLLCPKAKKGLHKILERHGDAPAQRSNILRARKTWFLSFNFIKRQVRPAAGSWAIRDFPTFFNVSRRLGTRICPRYTPDPP